jgi:hypothetical protein
MRLLTKTIVVTPAGRRRYLELLASYVLADPAVTEWQLWDNCREAADRAYIHALTSNPKVRVVTLPNSKGDNRSINKFYRGMNESDAFYVKIDDDLTYIEPGFFGRFHEKATRFREKAIWFSPLVINNAICTWLLAYHRKIKVSQPLSFQASCNTGWKSAEFSVLLHRFFLDALQSEQLNDLRIPDLGLATGRFSINCIGVFGAERNALGDDFCPVDVDDEEYISAVLPLRTGKVGQVIGSEIVAHFSYFTQEHILLRTDILDRYYALAKLQAPAFRVVKPSLKRRLLRALDDHRNRLRDHTPVELGSFLNE